MLEVKTITFERERLEAAAFVSNEVLETVQDHRRLGIELRLRAALLGRFLQAVVLTAPATWWDHFKLRFFPASWLRRWPAQMRRETYHVDEYLANRAVPDGESFVAMHYMPRARAK